MNLKLLMMGVVSLGIAGSAFCAPVKVLMLGGNQHHDYKKMYGELDRITLEKDDLAKVTYTENVQDATAAMADTDILMACGNVPYDDAFKSAFQKHLADGKSVMLMHAATWGRRGWKILNTEIVGGDPKGHEPTGLTFDVNVLQKDHPLMTGMNGSFEIVDELYRMKNKNPKIKWNVLSESVSRKTKQTYASIWLVEREGGKVLCCTLGHDEKSRVPDYNVFLVNAVKFLSKK
jgi:type 1 glutamine amidotransferase